MNNKINTPLLDKINCPADLRKLPESRLLELVEELRQFLLHSVSKSGGHFAASLGAAELTVALHIFIQYARGSAGLGRGASGLYP